MLISISGAQGSGKSTLINELIAQHGMNQIDRKTARSILSDWNMSLSDVYQNLDTVCKFQDELVERKYQDDLIAAESDETWITERTFADVFAYAVSYIGQHNEYDSWLNEYYEKCLEKQTIYDHVFYLQGGLFPVANDGVRPCNDHYGMMIDLFLHHYTNKMSPMCMTISDSDLAVRAEIVSYYI